VAFLNNVEQLRAVEWGAKYLWDIKFEPTQGAPLPTPFNEWFPAIDVEEDLSHVDSYSFETAQDTVKVPMHSTSLGLRVTFLDDSNHSLLNWFKDWMNLTIFNDGKFVSSVNSSIRQITLLKLNQRKEVVSNNVYWVYPEGTITFSGDGTSDHVTYNVHFVIVGKDIDP
jgi:hypothetical protein